MSASQVSAANRRASLRKSPRGSVRIELRKGALGLGPNIAAGFLDLSEGGIRMMVKAPLKQGDETEIILTSYGVREQIKRLANVCWVVPTENGQHCIGLKFQKRIPFREVQILALP